MTQLNLKHILSHAVRHICPQMDNDTFAFWCNLDAGNTGVTLPAFERGETVHAVFEYASPVCYFQEESAFSLNADQNTATLAVSFGRFCADPTLASEYAERASSAIAAFGWQMNTSFIRQSSLTLSTQISYTSEDDLFASVIDRLMMLFNDRFINELRPFLHYFNDESDIYRN
jgi:hypothetical protein